MHDIESILLLLIAAAMLVRLAEVVHVPAPIVLVMGGLCIALVPGLPRVALPPEVVFLVFLPPLVHSAGWYASPRELRAVVRPLGVLAVGLVFATAAGVAVTAHALVPGMGWAEAAVLGAVLAPTDTVAAIATFGRLGVPHRVRLIVEGEAMINDGTALVLYRIAVGVAAGGTITLGGAILQFLGNVAGGVLVGLAVGWLATTVMRRQSDSALITVVSLLGAYGAYIGAEELHASGILAAVVTGVYTGWQAPRILDADTRLQAAAFWRVLVFGLEITLFVLVGLQLPEVVDALPGGSAGVGDLLLPAAGIVAVSIALRMAVVLAIGSAVGETLAERVVVGWAGMRGAISLAAALAVPLAVAGRAEIVFLTFAVILATLVGQGLTLPLLLRAVHLPEERRWSDEEAAARMEAAQAALDRLDELEAEGAANEGDLRRLRDLYRARFRACMAVLGGDDREGERRARRYDDYGQLRRELIGVERDTFLDLRSSGRLSSPTMRQIQRDLDLEEARMRA
jgi:CPA1 family monovalent cation:H+ antiporter